MVKYELHQDIQNGTKTDSTLLINFLIIAYAILEPGGIQYTHQVYSLHLKISQKKKR